LLRDRFKAILGGVPAAQPKGNGEGQATKVVPRMKAGPGTGPASSVRHSHGLEQFFAYIRDRSGLTLLDLGETNQENILFMTSLGHKVYSEDLLHSLDQTFGPELSDQTHPAQINAFLRQNLAYHPQQFDGLLVWDVLQYMSPPLLAAVLARLREIVKPAGYLLCMFHAQERRGPLPYFTFRVQDPKTLVLTERGQRAPVQSFNNRTLEKLFQDFDSLKFFLTREQLREVIIKR
jgi:hypothetical protein